MVQAIISSTVLNTHISYPEMAVVRSIFILLNPIIQKNENSPLLAEK